MLRRDSDMTDRKVHKRIDNRGTSMVTVVISFALLMLFVTSYFKIQQMAEGMMMSSKDMIINNRNLIRAYYMGETENSVVSDNERIDFGGRDGGFFIEASLMKASQKGLDGTIYYFENDSEEEPSFE